MTEPCKQEGPIARLSTSLEAVGYAIGDMKEIHKETLTTLKILAEQGATIQSLSNRMAKSERDVDNIYGRMRDVELASQGHDDYIETRKGAEKDDKYLTTIIKGGLAVAVILAVFGFGLFLLDKSNYLTGRPTAPAKQK